MAAGADADGEAEMKTRRARGRRAGAVLRLPRPGHHRLATRRRNWRSTRWRWRPSRDPRRAALGRNRLHRRRIHQHHAGEPILPGWANILRDGHLVGRERIEMIPAGAETELGFGPIEGIRLATIFERNDEGDTGLISRSNTREQRITFTVENLTGEAQEVRAFFPLTYSEQEDLRVRVTASPAPDETDIDRKRGVSAWDLSIAPGETAEVEITVSLDWPEGHGADLVPVVGPTYPQLNSGPDALVCGPDFFNHLDNLG